MSFAVRYRGKPWKTRCGFRKKSTARFPPCWRRLRRSRTPLSTFREGLPSSPAGVLLYCECGISLGNFGDARARGIHWTSAAGRGVAKDDRSADPLAEPCNFVAGRAITCPAGAERSVRAARSRARPVTVFPAWNSGSRGVELSLLPCNSTDERGDGDHPAIHGAGLGAALYGGARGAGKKTVVAENRRGWTRGNRLRAGGRLCRLGRLPHGHSWSHRCATGCIFVRV